MVNLAQQGYSHEQIINRLLSPDGTNRSRYRLDVLRNGAVVVKDIPYLSCSIEYNYYNEVKYSASMVVWDNPMVDCSLFYRRKSLSNKARTLFVSSAYNF